MDRNGSVFSRAPATGRSSLESVINLCNTGLFVLDLAPVGYVQQQKQCSQNFRKIHGVAPAVQLALLAMLNSLSKH